MVERRESVRVDMTGNLTPEMLKAVLATKSLEQTLKSLSGTAVQTSRTSAVITEGLDDQSTSARRADQSINQLTGRLRLFADLAAVLTPAIAPVGGVLVAGMAGLANQLGVAALAGGTAILAFQGVGDALSAVRDAAVEPTTESLAKAREAMAALTPEARKFVHEVQEMRPAFAALRDSAAEGLFPGLVDGLDAIEGRFPVFERILSATSTTLGDLIAQGAEGLAGEEWDEFFDFLATDAQDSLVDLGATVGNLTRGLAELWVGLDPMSDDFSGWLRGVSEDFVRWSDGLSRTRGFREFIEYVRANGPRVAEMFSALGDAVLEIVEASAPLGGAVLVSLEAIAKVIGALADSDLGTPIMFGVAALAIYNRSLQVTAALQAKLAARGGVIAAPGTTGVLANPGAAADSKKELAGLRALPAAYREIGAAQREVSAAQAAQARAFATYNGQLQAINTLTARGHKVSMQSLDRLRDSLGRAEMANYSLTTATERLNQAEHKRGALLRSNAATIGKTSAVVGGLALATTGAANGIGLTNTASLALMGTLGGPMGVAIGASAGAVLDLVSASKSATESIAALNAAAKSDDLALMEEEYAAVEEKFAKYRDGDNTIGDYITGIGASFFTGGRFAKEYGAFEDLDAKIQQAREKSKAAQEAYSAALRNGGLSAQVAEHGLRGLVDAMKLHQVTATGALDAQYAWGAAVMNARDRMKNGKDGFNEFTQAGQENMAVVREMADVWNRDIEGAEAAGLSYDKVRKQIEDFAIAQDLGREAAEDLARDLLQFPDEVGVRLALEYDEEQLEDAKAAFQSLPRDVRTEIKAEGIPQTEAQVDALVAKYELSEKDRQALVRLMDMATPSILAIIARLNDIRDRDVTVTTTFREFYERQPKKTPKGKTPPSNDPWKAPLEEQADGGIWSGGVRRFADGGFGVDGRYYRRESQIVPGGANILWGEQETGWEAYISGKPSMRARNLRLMEEVADRLGVEVIAHPNGSAPRPPKSGKSGKSRKNETWLPAPIGGDFELPDSLRGLRREIKASERALKDETGARDDMVSKMSALGGDVAGGILGDVFGETDPWSAGQSIQDAIAKLNGQTTLGETRIKQIETLKGKGLEGDALADLLANADDATIANFTAGSTRELDLYEKQFEARGRAAVQASAAAQGAAFGAVIAPLRAEVRELKAELQVLQKIERQATKEAKENSKQNAKDTGRETGQQTKRGAGQGTRNTKRG